ADALALQQRQQLFRFLVGDHELDLDRHCRGELEEMLLVEDAMPSVSGDGAKRGSAVNSQSFRLFEQPLVHCDVMMDAIFVHVKTKQRTGHDVPQTKSARINRMPRMV